MEGEHLNDADNLNINNECGRVMVGGINATMDVRNNNHGGNSSNRENPNTNENDTTNTNKHSNHQGGIIEIERLAFYGCTCLKVVHFSNTLEVIGEKAFGYCTGLEALFFPPSLKQIGKAAFQNCSSLKVVKLPSDVEMDESIIPGPFGDHHHGRLGRLYNAAKSHPYQNQTEDVNTNPQHQEDEDSAAIDTSNDRRRIMQQGNNGGDGNEIENGHEGEDEDENIPANPYHQWMHHRNDLPPFHRLCCNTSISIRDIDAFVQAEENQYRFEIDASGGGSKCVQLISGALLGILSTTSYSRPISTSISSTATTNLPPLRPSQIRDLNQMTALHILTMNPFASKDATIICYHSNPNAALCKDGYGKVPLDYAREYNVPCLISIVEALCMHRISTGPYVEGAGTAGDEAHSAKEAGATLSYTDTAKELVNQFRVVKAWKKYRHGIDTRSTS